MKLKRTAIVAILCLVLCVSLLPVSAFADQTVVVIGGKLEQEPTVVTQNTSTYQGSTVISSGNSTTVAIVADSSGKNTIVEQKSSDVSSVVVMMPDGSSITPQPAKSQTAQATQALPVQQNTQTVAIAPQGLVNEILKLINAQRTANGLGILGYDGKLQATADLRARESAVSFGHTRPDGSAAVTAVAVDYNVAGENLIQVTTEYATAALMVETWMASPTHKANILLADFTQTALGVYEVNGVTYVSQIFTD